MTRTTHTPHSPRAARLTSYSSRLAQFAAGAAAVTLASAALAADAPGAYQKSGEQNQSRMQTQQVQPNQAEAQAQGNQAQIVEPLFVQAKNLVGKEVKDTTGQKLGTIKNLAVDTRRGQIAFAVLELGDWIGQGPNNLYAVPFEAIVPPAPGKDYATLKISKTQLKQAKGFSTDHYPNMNSQQWAQRADQQYGYQPYWESHYQPGAQRQHGIHTQQALMSSTQWLQRQGLTRQQVRQLQQAGFPRNQVQSDLEQTYQQQGMTRQDAKQKAKQASAQFQRRQMMQQHQQQQQPQEQSRQRNEQQTPQQRQSMENQPQGRSQQNQSSQNQQQQNEQYQTGQQSAQSEQPQPRSGQFSAANGSAVMSPRANEALTQWLEQQGVSQQEADRVAAAGFSKRQVKHALIEAYTEHKVPEQQARQRAQQMTRQFEQQKQQLTSGNASAFGSTQHGTRLQPAAYYQPRIELSNELIGTQVQNPRGEKLGVVNDLVIDTREGRIAYAVIQHGGVLGIGAQLAVVPYSAVNFEPNQKFAIVNTTEQQLAQVSFGSNHWPDLTNERWAARIHRTFNQQPYWQVYGYGFYINPQPVVFVGKVTDIQNAKMQSPNLNAQQKQNQQPENVRVIIQTGGPQSKTYVVDLAPETFLQQHNLTLTKGQTLNVTGFETQLNGEAVYKAQTVTSQNNTLHLRNEHGQPTWQQAQGATGQSQSNQAQQGQQGSQNQEQQQNQQQQDQQSQQDQQQQQNQNENQGTL